MVASGFLPVAIKNNKLFFLFGCKSTINKCINCYKM